MDESKAAKHYVKHLATIECVHFHNGKFTTKQRYITPELEKAFVAGARWAREQDDKMITQYSEELATARTNSTNKEYNWVSVGPGGCDSHNIEHPCGKCLVPNRTKMSEKDSVGK